MITVKRKSNFKNTLIFLDKLKTFSIKPDFLIKYAEKGLQLLKENTPEDSGKTKESWDYKIIIENNRSRIIFTNSNLTKEGTPVAILLQYGHGTRSGTWVEGIDYINPALKPLFENILNDIRKNINN